MNDIQTELGQLREKGWTLLTIADSLGVLYSTIKKWSAGMRYPANASLVKAPLSRLLKGKASRRRRKRQRPQPDIAKLSYEEKLARLRKHMGQSVI